QMVMTGRADYHVGWLVVAVQHIVLVRGTERVGKRRPQSARRHVGEWAVGVHGSCQWFALQILHHQRQAVRFLGEVVHLYTVRMVQDRKSTRLNSSHVSISYAVFCLKKKTK